MLAQEGQVTGLTGARLVRAGGSCKSSVLSFKFSMYTSGLVGSSILSGGSLASVRAGEWWAFVAHPSPRELGDHLQKCS